MTTAEQWEHLAREANAAAVKAMAEADRLRAELAALLDQAESAAPVGGQAEPSEVEWGVRQQPSGSVTVVSGPRSAQAIAHNRGGGAEAVTRRVTPCAAAAVSGEQP